MPSDATRPCELPCAKSGQRGLCTQLSALGSLKCWVGRIDGASCKLAVLLKRLILSSLRRMQSRESACAACTRTNSAALRASTTTPLPSHGSNCKTGFPSCTTTCPCRSSGHRATTACTHQGIAPGRWQTTHAMHQRNRLWWLLPAQQPPRGPTCLHPIRAKLLSKQVSFNRAIGP